MLTVEQLIIFLQFLMHIGDHLGEYGAWSYGILSAIIFAETGLVVFPFLPGDTLLFTAGAFCATGQLNLFLLNFLIITAAILGNTVNYWIGKYLVTRMEISSITWIDQGALKKTHIFFEKHGGKTIILARFVPIVRTFAPFVAGVSGMNFSKFQLFNIAGAVFWSGSLTVAGYFFGNLPVIKDNLNTIVLIGVGAAVILVLLTAFVRLIQLILSKKKTNTSEISR